MLTPRSPARVVISASTPWRSGTGHPQLGQPLGPGGPGRQDAPGRAGPLEHSSSAGPVAVGHPVAHRGQVGQQAGRRRRRWPRRCRRRRRARCPGWPAATRVMSRNPPAASRSRAASLLGLRGRPAFMRVAATRWGTWETTATRRSWSLGRQGHHVGPERADHGLQPGVGRRVGVGRRGEDPGGPDEQLGVGPVQAHLLGAGHGVAADEPGVVDGRHHRGLHPAHVGDHQRRAGAGSASSRRATVGHRAERGGDEGDVGVGVVARRRRGRPTARASAGPVGSASVPGDVPAPGPQGQAERTADQPGADDHGGPGGRGPPAASRSSGRSSRSPRAPWR